MTEYKNNRAIVKISVGDVRAEPVFESERLDQRLFNQTVTTGPTINGYVRVSWATGDGWMKQSYLAEVDEEVDYKFVIEQITVPIYEDDKSSVQSHLSFNTRVNVLDSGKTGDIEWCRIDSPQGKSGWVKASSLQQVASISYSSEEAIKKARSFLGIPYLWGGLSGFGLDCSGFVTSLASYYGYEYRHKTGKMVEFGDSVSINDLEPMDLLFFPDHVAIYNGNNEIIHSNTRGGGVSIDSILPDSPSYNPVIELLMVAKRMPIVA